MDNIKLGDKIIWWRGDAVGVLSTVHEIVTTQTIENGKEKKEAFYYFRDEEHDREERQTRGQLHTTPESYRDMRLGYHDEERKNILKEYRKLKNAWNRSKPVRHTPETRT